MEAPCQPVSDRLERTSELTLRRPHETADTMFCVFQPAIVINAASICVLFLQTVGRRCILAPGCTQSTDPSSNVLVLCVSTGDLK